MLEFLHKVMYIPSPSIIVAKTAKGIKMKMLVLRPIIEVKLMPIKLSQC